MSTRLRMARLSRCVAPLSPARRSPTPCPSTTLTRRRDWPVAEGRLASTTLPPSTIKSRPQYQGLQAVPSARHNLVAANGAGLRPVLRMVSDAPPGFAARTHLLYAESGTPAAAELDRLRSLGTAHVDVASKDDDVIRLLDAQLGTATMGTRLYA